MTLMSLTLRYGLFAVIATVVNLAAQRAVLSFGDETGYFVVAVAVGTLVGLAVKYLLDKRWIFLDASEGLRDHSQKFFLYSVMGIATTIIFWGMEASFWMIWKTDFMREIGAIFGLSIGYVVKYNLDRRFVFTDAQLGKTA